VSFILGQELPGWKPRWLWAALGSCIQPGHQRGERERGSKGGRGGEREEEEEERSGRERDRERERERDFYFKKFSKELGVSSSRL
jgi:hypothetical protein